MTKPRVWITALLATLTVTALAATGRDTASAATSVHPSGQSPTARPSTVRWVRFQRHRLFVRDYPGRGPALVLMHGFPDNTHLYDRLVPPPATRESAASSIAFRT